MSWSVPASLAVQTDKVSATFKAFAGITAAVGTLLLVSGQITSGGGGLTGLNVTDSSGNVYSPLSKTGVSGLQSFTFCYATVIAPGKALAGGTVTITRTGTTNITSYAAGISSATGGLTSSFQDTGMNASAAGNSGTPSVTSGAGSVAGNLVIAVMGENYTGIPAYSEAAGWTTVQSVFTSAATATGFAMAYQINAGTGALTHNPTVTGGAANSWASVITGFFVAGGGPTSNTNFLRMFP